MDDTSWQGTIILQHDVGEMEMASQSTAHRQQHTTLLLHYGPCVSSPCAAPRPGKCVNCCAHTVLCSTSSSDVQHYGSVHQRCFASAGLLLLLLVSLPPLLGRVLLLLLPLNHETIKPRSTS